MPFAVVGCMGRLYKWVGLTKLVGLLILNDPCNSGYITNYTLYTLNIEYILNTGVVISFNNTTYHASVPSQATRARNIMLC